jgi:hypothetical protein
MIQIRIGNKNVRHIATDIQITIIKELGALEYS